MTRIEEFEEYLKTKPTKAGKEYSRKYIMNLICYCRLLEKFCDGEVTIEKVNEFTKARRLQPSTVRAISTYLKFLGFKSEELRSEASGGRLYIPPRRVKKQIYEKVLSPEEIRKLIENAKRAEDNVAMRLLFETACRASGLLGIRIEDIDFEQKRILITEKGNKVRPVYFDDKMKEDLLQYIKEKGIQSGKIFDMKYQTLWYRIKSLGKRVLGKDISPHFFRHSSLTALADAGADVLDVKELAGHENISTSMIYIKISEKRRKAAFEKLPKV